jgi:hypothetical protein
VSRVHGAFALVEDRGDFFRAQPFEVTEDQEFAIGGSKFGEGGPHVFSQFISSDARAGARRMPESACQLGDGLIGKPHAAFFANDGAALGEHVSAVQFDESLPRQSAQPRIERHGLAKHVAFPLAGRVGQRLLHHVGRIDAGGQTGIDANGDHALESRSVQSQQLIASAGVARFGTSQQLFGVGLDHGPLRN